MLLLRVGKLLFLETSVVGVELLGVLDGVEFLEPERAPTLVLVYPEFLTSMDPVLDIFSNQIDLCNRSFFSCNLKI